MNAIHPSRQTGRSPIQNTPLTKLNPLSAEAAVSIRLWRATGALPPGDLLWESNDPAVYLALDLLQASQATRSAPRGAILVATFPAIQPAILTARRLQWALQGFSEAGAFAAAAAAVLVHSKEDLPGLEADDSALFSLEHAAPGQILLTPKTSEILRDLPGLPLKAVSEAGLCELLWRDSETPWSPLSDEEALSQLIQLNGMENEAPVAPPAPPMPAGADAAPSAIAGAEQVAPPAPALSASRPRLNQRLLIGAAAAAAILLIIVAIVAVSHKAKTVSASMPMQPAATAVAVPRAGGQPQSLPSNPAPKVETGPSTETAEPNRQARNSRAREEAAQSKRTDADAKKPQAVPQKATGDHCDLLPKMLDQAERSREQGHYPDAERQFRAVLACDHNNARALSGLNRVVLARQTEKQTTSP